MLEKLLKYYKLYMAVQSGSRDAKNAGQQPNNSHGNGQTKESVPGRKNRQKEERKCLY